MAKKDIKIEVGKRIQGLIMDRFKEDVESVIRWILNDEDGEEVIKKIQETGVDYMENVEYAMKEVCSNSDEFDDSYQKWIIETIIKGFVLPSRKIELQRILNDLLIDIKEQGISTSCFSIKGGGEATKDCDIAIDVNKEPEKLHKDFRVDVVPYDPEWMRLKFVIKEEEDMHNWPA